MAIEPQELFEGTEKESLNDIDRIAVAIEGQKGASWISFLKLYTQIKNAIIALFVNKAVLDELGDTGGALTYNGTVVSNSLAAGATTEVQFRNEITGALDSDPLFEYDPATKVLIAGETISRDLALKKLALGGANAANKTNSTSINSTAAVGLDSIQGGRDAAATGDYAAAYGSGATASANDTSAFGAGAQATALGATALGRNAIADKVNMIAIGPVYKTASLVYDFICGIGSVLFLEGNTNTKWFRINAATLIRSVEVTAIAPLVTGTVTAGTANTLTDSSKVFLLNQYANSVIKKTSIGGESEQRVILSNTTAGQVAVDRNWLATPTTTDTYKIITATVITSDNLSTVYSFNLSGGYDHAVILPLLSATFNRANIITYIEGFQNGARLHGFPSAGSGHLISLAPEFELVANGESVEHLSHYTATPHWDLKASKGLEVFASYKWAMLSVIANWTTYEPINTAITLVQRRRFNVVNVGGVNWLQYTSLITRMLKVGVTARVVMVGTPANVISVGIRHYNATTAVTTDIPLTGSDETLEGAGAASTFVLRDLIEFGPLDRIQIVTKSTTNTDYNITPQLIIN